MLAAGEFLASFAPNFAGAWPVVLLVLLFVVLFGHGFAVLGWRQMSCLLLGVLLFLLASTSEEEKYRECPWMRGREHRVRAQMAESQVRRMVRRDLSRRMAIGLGGGNETVSLSRAILLGERSCLPSRTKRIFVESGTMHVFAISGLHVMAVAKVLTVALSLLLVPLRWSGAFACPLLWGYVCLTGSSPSAVRAAIMMTFQSVAPLAWRRPDGLRAWALTFLLVHVLDPLLVVNVGNVLSFVVMLAIVLAGDCGRGLPKWKRELLVTVAAWAVGVPISAHVFGRVTPGGMLANLVLIAAAKLTVYTGAMGLMASSVSEAVTAHLNNLSALAIRAMMLVAEVVSKIPGANIETRPWTLLTCAAWYAGVALVFALMIVHMKRKNVL